MDSWIPFLKSTIRKVNAAITPLLGTSEGNVDVGNGAGGDITKKVDEVAEDIILAELESTGLAMNIVTEEKGIVYLNCTENDANQVEWHVIVDPIDGSVNATKNLPFFAVSIAISRGPRFRDISDAVVSSVATGDIFTASRGQGSMLNGKPLSLSESPMALSDAVMGIDLNHKRGEFVRSELVHEYASLINTPRKIRVLGSNALELCLVASGALDCFADVRGTLRVIDIAAAWLIVKEAGGHVFEVIEGSTSDLDDLEFDIGKRLAIVAASSLDLIDEMMLAWK